MIGKLNIEEIKPSSRKYPRIFIFNCIEAMRTSKMKIMLYGRHYYLILLTMQLDHGLGL